MEEMKQYTHFDTWFRRGNNFAVEVKHEDRHHLEIEHQIYKNHKHRWWLYAYLYKGHPLTDLYIESINSDDFYTEMITHIGGFSFHGGCTFAQIVGECIKIGCDYEHYQDDDYFTMSPEYAQSVFRDAEGLFNALQNIDTKDTANARP